MSAIIEINLKKLQELVLYVADRSSDDPAFGATKLNKLLFFCDFFAYASLGEPITGATYQKGELGPVPQQLPPMHKLLELNRDAAIQRRTRYGRQQKRLIPLRDPDLDVFSAREIALVDRLIAEHWGESARDMTQLSHRIGVGWQVAEFGEEIPYCTVFLSAEPLTPSEISHAQRFAAQHGLLADA